MAKAPPITPTPSPTLLGYRARRRIVGLFAITPPLLFLLLMISFCVGKPSYYVAKYEGSGLRVQADALPTEWSPQKQVEPHTCGLHAVSSIYLAYGLDPEAAKLRFRLGTDKPGTNFDPESVGTIHPDILRVVRQDGFDASTHLLMDDDTARAIRDHLRSGHPVLAMIRVTGLHWIVLTSLDGDDVIVCDSLHDGLLREPFNDFVPSRVKSAILLRPHP